MSCEATKEISGLRIPAGWLVGHAVVCMFQAHQSYAVAACPRHKVAQSSSCKCSDWDLLQTLHVACADTTWELAMSSIPSRPFGYDQV